MSHRADRNDGRSRLGDGASDRDKRTVPWWSLAFSAGFLAAGFLAASAVAVVLAFQSSSASNDLDESQAALEMANRDLSAAGREVDRLTARLVAAESARADGERTDATSAVCVDTTSDPCIEFTDIRPTADGQGLLISWDSFGFTPSLIGVHGHFYWDVFAAEQVGANAPGQRGEWAAIADQSFDTTGTGVALSNRPEGAVQLCVTPANGAHEVVDPAVFHCVDLPG